MAQVSFASKASNEVSSDSDSDSEPSYDDLFCQYLELHKFSKALAKEKKHLIEDKKLLETSNSNLVSQLNDSKEESSCMINSLKYEISSLKSENNEMKVEISNLKSRNVDLVKAVMQFDLVRACWIISFPPKSMKMIKPD